MKILFLSQYYPPESNAPAVRTSEMAECWVRDGHDVTVLTAFPHHPTGVIPPEYRGAMFRREERNGVKVVRTYVYVAPNKGVIRRSLSYISWMLSAIVLGGIRAPRPDVVVATSPQFLCAVAGYVVSVIKRRPFVMEVRDLWPESIVAVGALKDGFLVELLHKVERFLYRRAKAIVSVSPGFFPYLRSVGIPEGKLHLLPNGVDLVRFTPARPSSDVYAAAGVRQPFRVLYSGTVGMAHGLELVIEAGDRLRGTEVALVVVGEGARRRELLAEVERRQLDNVFFVPMQPRESMTDWISGANVVLVHLKRSPLFETVLPSKLFEYMGCDKPVLMGVAGVAAEIVRGSGCGWLFEPDNVDQFLDALSEARNDPAAAAERGSRGRAYVEKHYDREKLARRYVTAILSPLAQENS
ncbi:MAG: glycosyltransferase family 4 protein [Thermoanaerobaculia bacterium]